jgi:Domain of unknown function (DUF6985)
METISDEVFGELEFNGNWVRKIDLSFLGVSTQVDLIVEGNGERALIFDEQRAAYQQLPDAVVKAEAGILDFYRNICDDYRDRFGNDADIRMPRVSDKSGLFRLVRLTGVIFPLVMNSGEVSVGFLLECSWEPEHGLGAKITNGAVEVGTQDILT